MQCHICSARGLQRAVNRVQVMLCFGVHVSALENIRARGILKNVVGML